MRSLKLDEDTGPLSESRAGAALITEYTAEGECRETIDDVAAARAEFAVGAGVEHVEAKAQVLARLRR